MDGIFSYSLHPRNDADLSVVWDNRSGGHLDGIGGKLLRHSDYNIKGPAGSIVEYWRYSPKSAIGDNECIKLCSNSKFTEFTKYQASELQFYARALSVSVARNQPTDCRNFVYSRAICVCGPTQCRRSRARTRQTRKPRRTCAFFLSSIQSVLWFFAILRADKTELISSTRRTTYMSTRKSLTGVASIRFF